MEGFDLRVLGAERIGLSDARFDALTAAFVVFFLPNPQRAAAEFGPRAVFRNMAGLKTAEGYPMDLNAWIVTGRRS